MQITRSVLAVGIPEAARRLGLSPRTVASLIARREIRSQKVGRRRIIPLVELERFLEQGSHQGEEYEKKNQTYQK